MKIVGSLALLYIAVTLMVPSHDDKGSEIEASESLWRAVRVVAIADLVMSLDNVIAIAGAAKGSIALIAIGLATSIPLIIAGAALITSLFDRFPLLIPAGAALLGWVAGEMLISDPFVASMFGSETVHALEYPAAVAGAVIVLAIGAWLKRTHRHSSGLAVASAEGTEGGATKDEQ